MRGRPRTALLSLLLLAACGPGEPPLLVPETRLFATGPLPLYRSDLLLQPRPEFIWQPGLPGELARWRATTEDVRLEARRHAAIVTAPSGSASLVRRTRIDAGDIDAVWVQLARTAPDDPDTGVLSLLWAGPGESTSSQRRLVARSGETLADGSTRYRFQVSDHPEWRGEVVRLALGLALPPSGEVALTRVAGYSERTRRDLLTFVARGAESLFAPVAAEAWRLERSPPETPAADLGQLTLWRETDLEASEIDTLEVEIDDSLGKRERYVALLWAGTGEGLAAERSLALSTGLKVDENTRRYIFRVGRHPAWRGRVTRLALRTFAGPGEEIEPGEMRGYREEVRLKQVAAAAGGFELALDGEVRPALLATSPIERRLELPPEARLRFAYGVEGVVEPPVRFAVSVAEESAGQPVTLLERSVDPASAGGWQDEVVDLTPWGGRVVELRLTATTDAPVDLRHGFPVWGAPEILSPDSRPSLNVVLISIDTLRADRLSLYGHSRETSPRLDAWAARAAVFENVVAPSPWTLPSHISLLTGLDAHRHGGETYLGTAPAALPLLPEILREGGRATLAVTGGGMLDPLYGFARGFDRYRFFTGAVGDEDELDRSLETAVAWLEEHRETPFFLFFHTYEVHAPFRPRQPWFDRFTDLEAPPEPVMVDAASEGAEAGFLGRTPLALPGRSESEAAALLEALYDSGVAFTDDRIGRLLDRLGELGLDDRTVVAVTSDHGELLGERGLANHGYLDEENLLVPLLIAAPSGIGAGLRVGRQVRLHDLFPTLLELAGEPLPEEIDGRSLVPFLEDRPAEVPQTAWTYASGTNQGIALRLDNRLKYVLNNTAWQPLQGRERFYRLEKGRESPVDAAEVSRAAALRREARRVLEEQTPGLRLRFSNTTGHEISGSVRGAPVHPVRVKSADMNCDCLEWAGPAEARFRVPSGRSFTVNFENATTWKLELAIDASPEDSDGLRHRFALWQLQDRQTVGLTAEGWRELEPGEAGAASVSLWWVGQRPGEAMTVETPDPRLSERLRALGYIE